MVFAKPHITSANLQRASLNDALRQCFSGAGIDRLHRSAGNFHLFRASLLCKPL